MSRRVWQQRLTSGLLVGLTLVALLPPLSANALPEVIEPNSAPEDVDPTTDGATDTVNGIDTAQQADATTTVDAATVQSELPAEPQVVPAAPAEVIAPTTIETTMDIPQYMGVIVTQIQTTGGTGRSGEDIIEITNNSGEDIDITNWEVHYLATTGPAQRDITLEPSESGVGWHLILPARASYLLGTKELIAAHTTEQNTFTVDQQFTSGIANGAGSITITDSTGVYQSGVAWGTSAPAEWREGQPALMPTAAGGMIERKMLESGWFQQSRDNKIDFYDTVHSALRAAYVTGQAIEVFDMCTNLGGMQAGLPDGYTRNKLTGECSSTPPPVLNTCGGLMLTELGANLDEQFIELYNSGDAPLSLKGCSLQTNRSATKSYVFPDETLAARAYMSVPIASTGLTLTKTTTGTVYLLDEANAEIDTVAYSGLNEDTSLALIEDTWQQTYALTPGATNIWLAYPPCAEGYYRNDITGRCNKIVTETAVVACVADQYRSPETGRCRKIESDITELSPCAANQYRNAETNRCRNIISDDSTLTPCKEGQYRSPETNRCRSIAVTASALTPCNDGYERNPDTNRCRKITTTSTIPVAAFPVEEVKDSGSAFVAWWALGGVVLVGIGYATWEWRHEIKRMIQSASMYRARQK